MGIDDFSLHNYFWIIYYCYFRNSGPFPRGTDQNDNKIVTENGDLRIETPLNERECVLKEWIEADLR